jgi:uncharacterized protein (TIGR02246 family)
MGIGIVILMMVQPAIALPLALSPHESMTTTPETIHTLIETAKTAWITQDADGFASLFAEDGCFMAPGFQAQGRQAIRQTMLDFAKSNVRVQIEIQQVVIDGDRAMLEWTWRSTNQQGDTSVADDAIAVDVQDGKISRWREYIDEKTPDA